MTRHRVIFEPMGVTVEADTSLYPYGRNGEPGSILDIAVSHGVQVEHACGGAGVCATCHVIVVKGEENLSPAGDDELDVVDMAPNHTPQSRLACKAVVCGDVVVRIPGWNRNAASEKS
jgi:ferredoxin, 2Fe-2S